MSRMILHGCPAAGRGPIVDWSIKTSVCFISARVVSCSSRQFLGDVGRIVWISAVCLQRFEDSLQCSYFGQISSYLVAASLHVVSCRAGSTIFKSILCRDAHWLFVLWLCYFWDWRSLAFVFCKLPDSSLWFRERVHRRFREGFAEVFAKPSA